MHTDEYLIFKCQDCGRFARHVFAQPRDADLCPQCREIADIRREQQDGNIEPRGADALVAICRAELNSIKGAN